MSLFYRVLSFFRSYITVFTVIFLLSAVSITNSISKENISKENSLFSSINKVKNCNNNETVIIKNTEKNENSKEKIIPIVKIASASSNILLDLNEKIEEERDNRSKSENLNTEIASFSLFNGTSFIAPAVYFDESILDNLKYGIVKYIVKAGDTPSSIATSFGVSTYTILWANDLKVGNYIKPNQELEILPITGVKHIVQSGDTIETIAKKYKADKEEIIIFNYLNADGIFQDGAEGKTLIIPNGKMKAPVIIREAPTPRTTNGQIVSSSKYKTSTFYNPLNSHRFAYGHCTYYVASQVYIPWSGHAKSWLTNSRAHGYRTGNVPVVGSIVVTTESRWYGHVAFVESVSANSITVSEMNYVGWNRRSIRVISRNSSVIRGYIYMN